MERGEKDEPNGNETREEVRRKGKSWRMERRE